MSTILLTILIAYTQAIAVQTLDAPPNTIVPGAIATLSGPEWVSAPVIGSWGGDVSLAGYSVTVGGVPCLLTYIGAEIVFIAPQLPPGTAALAVAGPSGAFSATVTVIAAWPRLVEQEGFVVATSHQQYYPRTHVGGDPVPVSPTAFRLIGIQARGLQPETPVTVILDGPERYEIGATAHEMPGYHGTVNVLLFAPPCVAGTYAVTLRLGGVESPAVAIRFAGSCTIQARPGRAGR